MVNKAAAESVEEIVEAEVVEEKGVETVADSKARQAQLFGQADVWDDISDADVFQISAELVDKVNLIGVPFMVTQVHYRTGAFLRDKESIPDDFVSLSVVTAPLISGFYVRPKIEKRRQKALDDMEGKMARKLGFTLEDYAEPEEFVVVNDSSTGIKRQVTAYLAHKKLIVLDTPELPSMNSMTGSLGENVYDQNRDEWKSGSEAATKGFNVKMLFKQGLRVSAYENELNAEGSATFYLT